MTEEIHRTLKSLIALLGDTLTGRRDLELALLFGSHARGRAHDGSDVDVAVLGRDVDVLELARDLSLAVGKEVDVVRIEDAGYPLLKSLLRDGKLVHEGRRSAWGLWRSRTIAQLEVDRPWFERMRDAYLRRLAEEDRAGG